MSKIYTGKDGILRVGDTDQVKVTNWSLQAEMDVLETTALGDDDRSYVPGLRSYSGTASLLYYQDDASRNDAATMIKHVISTGAPSTTPVAITFRLRDGINYKDVKINAFVTSVTHAVTVGEIVTAQISFRGTGAVTTLTI